MELRRHFFVCAILEFLKLHRRCQPIILLEDNEGVTGVAEKKLQLGPQQACWCLSSLCQRSDKVWYYMTEMNAVCAHFQHVDTFTKDQAVVSFKSASIFYEFDVVCICDENSLGLDEKMIKTSPTSYRRNHCWVANMRVFCGHEWIGHIFGIVKQHRLCISSSCLCFPIGQLCLPCQLLLLLFQALFYFPAQPVVITKLEENVIFSLAAICKISADLEIVSVNLQCKAVVWKMYPVPDLPTKQVSRCRSSVPGALLEDQRFITQSGSDEGWSSVVAWPRTPAPYTIRLSLQTKNPCLSYS